jgi:hypothetical protein
MNAKRIEYIFNKLNSNPYNAVMFTPVKMKYLKDYINYYGLYLSHCKQFIKYNSYGSSAVKNTIEELSWIIKNIFHNDNMKEVNLYDDR